MIYEVRTYTLHPGTVAKWEENFGKALPVREKFSKLGAFWHTELGPLNQVIHVWPYEDLADRNRVRAEAAGATGWPPPSDGAIINMQSEIWVPAPFMRPMGGDQALGNIYEMRTYTCQPGSMNEVIKRGAEAVPHREEFSPLAAAMHCEVGGLNRWMHVWPYKDMEHRDSVRAAASESPHWPPPTREFFVSQETKFMVPASFSPMH